MCRKRRLHVQWRHILCVPWRRIHCKASGRGGSYLATAHAATKGVMALIMPTWRAVVSVFEGGQAAASVEITAQWRTSCACPRTRVCTAVVLAPQAAEEVCPAARHSNPPTYRLVQARMPPVARAGACTTAWRFVERRGRHRCCCSLCPEQRTQGFADPRA